MNHCGSAFFFLSQSTDPGASIEPPLLVEMGRDLRKVLAGGEKDGGDILRELIRLLGLMASMSECMACGVLHV